MKKTGLLASMLAALCISTAPSAQSQELYWTTSGFFGPFNIQGLIPTYPKAKDITIPVSMWILKHPKGVVVFDTGNNVAISDGADNCKKYWAAGSCDFLRVLKTTHLLRGRTGDQNSIVLGDCRCTGKQQCVAS